MHHFVMTGVIMFVGLITANPVPDKKSDGVAVPLTKHSSFLNTSNGIVDLDSVSYHINSARAKIFDGFENYKRNTGTTHPLAINESRPRKRSTSIALKSKRDTWYAEISIGSPGKPFTVEIDPGSSDLFVPRFDCGFATCKDHNLWWPRSSTTAKGPGKSFWLNFADGATVSGFQYSDSIAIAGLAAYPQTFGAATSYSSRFQADKYPADGLLGLAFPSISRYPAHNLFITLALQKKLINPTLSFKLASSGGEMYIGGANSMLYNGFITYTRVTHLANWQVVMDNVKVDGNNVVENVPAIIDTGSNYIFGDWDRVADVYKDIGGTLRIHMGYGYYTLPCRSFPEVSLTFGGKSFPIDPNILNIGEAETSGAFCFGGIIATPEPSSYWTIGSLFLQGVYTVLDYGTLKVGFAELA